MKNRTLRSAIAALLAGSAGATANMAYAQQAGGLEEIVVTATRREENLQDVPISIVAVTGANLELRGVDTLEEVSQAIPNVVVTGGGSSGTQGTGFSVRGIPNVGTYVDGIWQIDSAGALVREFVDLDRIEVLRGPQGTTFGRDSTGGAIRLWTKRPGEEFGGTLTATLGSLDRRDVKGVVDVPLSDTVFTKWTAASMLSRRLHPKPHDRREGRRRRSKRVPRRRAVERERRAVVAIQLSVQQERLHGAEGHRRDLPHFRRPRHQRRDRSTRVLWPGARCRGRQPRQQPVGLPGRPGRRVGEPLQSQASERGRAGAAHARHQLGARRVALGAVPDGLHQAVQHAHERLGRESVRPGLRRQSAGQRPVQPRDPILGHAG